MSDDIREVGHIVSYFSGVATIKGLPHIFLHEVLLDKDNNEVAIVVGFDEESVDALLFNESFDPGQHVYRSKQIFSVPVSESYVGRIVDGFGKPRDDLQLVEGDLKSVFGKAPDAIDREPVKLPFSTGIKIIDATLPLGKGQRELIIGDRRLGKSTIAQDIVLQQRKEEKPVYCIYVICGQKIRQLDEITALFRKYGTFTYTIIVAATAEDSFAAQYLAPLVGCTIAEYFRDSGKDALIVYDDLTKHAKTYRDITLLLRRPPGREAYPGDIFSLHAELLERAAKLSPAHGGGSLTALPIAETQEGDITSFIPTNLISITDGQIYLEQGLFQKNFLPAINVGLSVSRIGSQAQTENLRSVTGGIRLSLAQHKELQKLTQLETTVSKETQKNIYRGELILEILNQKKHVGFTFEEQVILFYTVEMGFFDQIEREKLGEFEDLLLDLLRNKYPQILKKIHTGKFDEKIKQKVAEIVKTFQEDFLYS